MSQLQHELAQLRDHMRKQVRTPPTGWWLFGASQTPGLCRAELRRAHTTQLPVSQRHVMDDGNALPRSRTQTRALAVAPPWIACAPRPTQVSLWCW